MPDIFIPVDTAKSTAYLRKINMLAITNRVAMTYVDKHRDELKKNYPTIDLFKKNFALPDAVMTELKELAEKEKIYIFRV